MTSPTNNMRKVLGPKLGVLLVISALLSYSLRQQWKSVNTNTRAVADPINVTPDHDGGSDPFEAEGDEEFDVEPASNDVADGDDGNNDEDVNGYKDSDDDFKGNNVNLFPDKEDDFEKSKVSIDEDDNNERHIDDTNNGIGVNRINVDSYNAKEGVEVDEWNDNKADSNNGNGDDNREDEDDINVNGKMDAFDDEENKTKEIVNDIKELSEGDNSMMSPEQEGSQGTEFKDNVQIVDFPKLSDDNTVHLPTDQRETAQLYYGNDGNDLENSVLQRSFIDRPFGNVAIIDKLRSLMKTVGKAHSVDATAGETSQETKALPVLGNFPGSNINDARKFLLPDNLVNQRMMGEGFDESNVGKERPNFGQHFEPSLQLFPFLNSIAGSENKESTTKTVNNELNNIHQSFQLNHQVLPFPKLLGAIDGKLLSEINVLNALSGSQVEVNDKSGVNPDKDSLSDNKDTEDIFSNEVIDSPSLIGDGRTTMDDVINTSPFKGKSPVSDNQEVSVLNKKEQQPVVVTDIKTNSIGFRDHLDKPVRYEEEPRHLLNNPFLKIPNEKDAQGKSKLLDGKPNTVDEQNHYLFNNQKMMVGGVDAFLKKQNFPAQVINPQFDSLNSAQQSGLTGIKGQGDVRTNANIGDPSSGDNPSTMEKIPNVYPVFESPGFDDFRGFDIKYTNHVDEIAEDTTDGNSDDEEKQDDDKLDLKSGQLISELQENGNDNALPETISGITETNVDQNTDESATESQDLEENKEHDNEAEQGDEGKMQLSTEQDQNQLVNVEGGEDNANQNVENSNQLHRLFESNEATSNHSDHYIPENVTEYLNLISKEQNDTAPYLTFQRENNVFKAIEENKKRGSDRHETNMAGDPVLKSPRRFRRSLLSVFTDRLDGFNTNGDGNDYDLLGRGGREGGRVGLDGDKGGYIDNGNRVRNAYPYRLFIEEDDKNEDSKAIGKPTQHPDVNTGYVDGKYDYSYDVKPMENFEGQRIDQGGFENFVINNHNNDLYDHDDKNSNNDNNYKTNNDFQREIYIPNEETNNRRQTSTPNNNGGSYDNPRPLTQEEYNALHTLPYNQKPVTHDPISEKRVDYTAFQNNVITQIENPQILSEKKQEDSWSLNQNYFNNNFEHPFQDHLQHREENTNQNDEPFQDLKEGPNYLGETFQQNNLFQWLIQQKELQHNKDNNVILSDDSNGDNAHSQYPNEPLFEKKEEEEEIGLFQRLKNEAWDKWSKEIEISDDDNSLNYQVRPQPFLTDEDNLKFISNKEDIRDVTLQRLPDCPINLELSPVPHDVAALVIFPGALADWLKNAIEQISGEPSDSLYNVMASLKNGDSSAFFRMPRQSVIHTHSALSTEFDRAILIVNNPLAVEEKHLLFLPFAYEWRRYFLWDYTITSWLSSDLPLLVLTPDDLIADPETNMRKIASFLGISDDRVDTSLTCALQRKPPVLIDDVTKMAGVYSRDRKRLSKSIDDVIEIASRKAPDILHRLFQYKAILYI